MREFLAQHPIRMPDATPEPQQGQIWRAAWEDAVADVYIVDADDDIILAMPVTPDSGIVSAIHHLGEDESPLGYAIAVWAGLQRELPLIVLDGCYGQIEDPLGEVDLPAQSELIDSAREVDPRSEFIGRLERQFELLATATWMPPEQPIGPIRELVRGTGLRLRDIRDQTSLADEILTRINRSTWWLPASQIEELFEALATSPSDLPRSEAFFDTPGLPRAINSPSRKAAFRDFSRRKDISEAEARLEAADQVLAAAARQSKPEVDEQARWDYLLDVYRHDA